MKYILVIFLFVILFSSACEEFEVEPITQVDELKRYIADSYIGESLFKKPIFSNVREYSFSGNDTIYIETVDSVVRSVFITSFGVDTLDYGTFNSAEATINDRLYGNITKNYNNDQVVETFVRDFDRFGYFMKLGDDNQKFSGWLLYGYYSGGTDVDFQLSGAGRINSSTDYKLLIDSELLDYLPIDSLTVVEGNSLLTATSDISTEVYNIFITYETDTGIITSNLKRDENNIALFLDTVLITPPNDRFGNLIFIEAIQYIHDTVTTFIHNYSSIPYEYKN